jgi:hypothetical protein
VQAQYAIRNNQRNFLKITLPAGAAIWSASLAGKPVRPGEAKDGSLLLPLEKSRAGEEAPAFLLEIFYLVRQTAWTDKGKATLVLPAVDLPISRTGLLFYHPPLFKLAPEAGTFRVETYEAPTADAFHIFDVGAGSGIDLAASAPYSANGLRGRSNDKQIDGQNNNDNRPQSATQILVDNFKTKTLGGRGAKVLPIRPSFPAFGPSLFFVSELTAENHAPALEFNYQRDKKDGGK